MLGPPFDQPPIGLPQPYAMPQYDQYMTDEDFTMDPVRHPLHVPQQQHALCVPQPQGAGYVTLFTSLNNNMAFVFLNPNELGMSPSSRPSTTTWPLSSRTPTSWVCHPLYFPQQQHGLCLPQPQRAGYVTLFTSLNNNMAFVFPNPKELGMSPSLLPSTTTWPLSSPTPRSWVCHPLYFPQQQHGLCLPQPQGAGYVTLFTSLNNNMAFVFPNPKELGMSPSLLPSTTTWPLFSPTPGNCVNHPLHIPQQQYALYLPQPQGTV